MGQAGSRAVVSRVKDAGSKAARSAASVVPTIQANEDERGSVTLPAEEAQMRYMMMKKGAKNTDTNPEEMEMDADLLKFLTESPPLERKVDKEHTSKRLLRESLKPLEDPDQVNPVDSRRTSKLAPLLSDLADLPDKEFTTMRTTNFAQHDANDVDELEEDNAPGLQVDIMYNRLVGSDSTPFTSKEEETVWNQTAAALTVPVLMKDPVDNSYIGVRPEKVDDYKKYHKLEHVHESRVIMAVKNWQLRESVTMRAPDTSARKGTETKEA